MIIGFAFLLIGIGAILQQLGYLPADLDLFWAIIFIAIGLSLLFERKGMHRIMKHWQEEHGPSKRWPSMPWQEKEE